jgi:hypothetical protein
MSVIDVDLSHCKACRIVYGCCADYCHICEKPTVVGDLSVAVADLRQAMDVLFAPLVRVVDWLADSLEKLRVRFPRALSFLAVKPSEPQPARWVGFDMASGRDRTAIFHTGLMAGVSINEFRGFKMTVPRRPTKKPRESVFFAPLDLLIQPQGDKCAQDYASRVNVEAWNQCRRFGREPNNARASVTRHIHKLTRYSQRALTGRG